MPPNFRDRGGRLQAFVRGKSDGNIDQKSIPINNNAAAKSQLPEKRPIAPQTIAPVAPAPMRQQLVEPPRIPPAQSGRYTAPLERARSGINTAPFPPPPKSPTYSEQASPTIRARADSVERKDIFAGSQLGESFMESGLSTPCNEPADPVVPEPEPVRDFKKNVPRHQSPARNNVAAKTTRPSRDTEFLIGEDGMMSIIPGNSRYNPSHMRDGFQNGTVNGHRKSSEHYQSGRRPSSPFDPQTKLPVREVKIRRSQAGGTTVFAAANDKSRPSSPPPKNAHRQNHHKRENERRFTRTQDTDEEVESQADEDEQTTPKAIKTKPPSQRVSMGSSLPLARAFVSPSKSRKRKHATPDYDDKALSAMSFEDLQKQSFDFDPSKAIEQRGFGSGGDQLADKLDQCRHLSEAEQRQFFSAMPMDDWEASGQWFADQFAELMNSLIIARQKKRRTVQQFEKEAASREEAVRLRSQAIDRKLVKMKQDGQRVVEDRGV